MRYEKILPLLLSASDVLPRRHRVRAKEEQLSCRPFYILGSGRNGSTLLGTMLNRHPDLLVIPEQFALPYATIRYRLLNWLDWQDLVKLVVGEYSDPKNALQPRSYTHLIPELYAVPKPQRSLRTIVDRIVVDYGRSTGRPFTVWGDKSPLNTRMFRFIKPVVHGTRIIFLLRDGRDVVASYMRADKDHMADHVDPRNAAAIWKQSIRVLEELKRTTPPGDLLIVRYEDMISDAERTLSAICSHLGVVFDRRTLDPENGNDTMGVSGMSHHANVQRPMLENNTGTWKDRLDSDTLAMVLPILESDLKFAGYH